MFQNSIIVSIQQKTQRKRIMTKINIYLKNKLHYSEYQIQILCYFILTVGSELSKFIILFTYFLFWSQEMEYLFSTFLLWYLRFFGGGLHKKTYLGCLLYSFIYLTLCIQLLPLLHISKILQVVFLFSPFFC